ncbi:MAG: MaoC family dehydratase [Thermoleophilia bacterium]
MTYADIDVGMEFPEVVVSPTDEVCRRYAEVVGEIGGSYDESGGAAEDPTGSIVASPTLISMYGTPSVLLSGYDPKVIPPPGNIHYSQDYEFQDAVHPGDRLRIHSKVLAKEVRRGRNYVTIESEYINQRGVRVAVGRITAVWSR